jgi:DNA-binding NtrC family response regulator
MNFLFIERDKNVSGTLYPLLAKKNNADCRIVESCQSAIKLLKEGYVPNFVFIEYEAGPGNGMDVILYLQTREYADRVKILMTTSLQDYRKIESMAGMLNTHFERKPLQLFSLQRFINESLSEKQP